MKDDDKMKLLDKIAAYIEMFACVGSAGYGALALLGLITHYGILWYSNDAKLVSITKSYPWDLSGVCLLILSCLIVAVVSGYLLKHNQYSPLKD
jgi:hypothetical protein